MKGLLNSGELFFDNNFFRYHEDLQQFHNAGFQSIEANNAKYHGTGSIKTYSGFNNKSVRSKFASYHVYQRSSDRSIVFKSGKDAIVFISIVKVKAIKLGILVYAICLMDNHIHMLVKARDKSSLHRFVTDYTSLFAKLTIILWKRTRQRLLKNTSGIYSRFPIPVIHIQSP